MVRLSLPCLDVASRVASWLGADLAWSNPVYQGANDTVRQKLIEEEEPQIESVGNALEVNPSFFLYCIVLLLELNVSIFSLIVDGHHL
jgi:hypothetical protein